MLETKQRTNSAIIKTLKTKHLKQVEFSIDQVGKVFFYGDKVFRGISEEYVPQVKEMFDSGMIEELVSKDLLVNTWISATAIEGYHLVLEHECIPFWNYPYEWSATMLYRAAHVVLAANEVANKYGYELFDGHAFNVVFDMTKPKYVDIGSFFKRDDRNGKCWSGYLMFYNSFYLPLYLYNKGYSDLPNSIFLYNGYFNYKDFYLIKYKYSQFLGRKLNNICYDLYDKTRRLAVARYASIIDKYGNHPHINKLIRFKKLYQNRFSSSKAKSLVNSAHKPNINVPLKNNQYIKPPINKKYVSDIITLIQTELFDADTLIELGTEGKELVNGVLKNTQIEHYIATTTDKNLLENLFISFENSHKVLPFLYDFIRPNNKNHTLNKSQRIKADIVMAIDRSHHLLLEEDVSLTYFLNILSKHTKKYVIVDFMPLGVQANNMKNSSATPDNYTLSWFRDNFAKKFECIFDKKMSTNQYLFIGKLKD